jgi:hypothetical protein
VVAQRELSLLMLNVPPEEWCLRVGTLRQKIGTSPVADVHLPENSGIICELHAEVWADELGAWISDLCSLSGTRVNNVTIPCFQPARIVPGDLLWLGGVELEVVEHPARLLPLPPDFWSDFEKEWARSGGAKGRSLPSGSPAASLAEGMRNLTGDEFNLLMFLHRGFISDQELAEVAQCPEAEIRLLLESVCVKLGAHSRGELLAIIIKYANNRFDD